MDEQITAPTACASPDGAPSLPAPTSVAGAQTGAVVLSADWPTYAHVPGRYLAASVPGTADVLINGRRVTIGLAWDVGGEERPYVADYTDGVTLAECDAIDRAVHRAWDAAQEAA